MVSALLPLLERILVFQEDQEQVKTIQSISQRLLTSSDLDQLLEGILAANCDLLQVPVAFIATFEGDQAVVKQKVGNWTPEEDWREGSDLKRVLTESRTNATGAIVIWDKFWVVPLYSIRIVNGATNGNGHNRLLGVLAVQARSENPNLSSDEQHVFEMLVDRAAQILDDRLLQMDVFASLEGLLPEMEAIQQLRDLARYGDFPVFAALQSRNENGPDPEFANAVFDALRDYWGGPRLTQSPLLNLNVVQAAMPENDGNPTKALRAVLHDAVNRLRPVGERSMTRAEWTLYNIVDLRFVQGYKVRDVATRLVMSEADLYRKQRVAVEQVARVLADMERRAKESQVS